MRCHRLSMLAVLLAFATACSSADPSTPPRNLLPTPTSSQGPATIEMTDNDLMPAFIAYIFPLNGTDIRVGWNTFDKPSIRQNLRAIGSCVEAEGFDGVAAALREADLPNAGASWLFPDMATLRSRGFVVETTGAGWNLLGSMEPNATIADPEHPLVQDLVNSPELGVTPTLEAANELNSVLWSCTVTNQLPTAFEQAQQLAVSWRAEIARIDDTPAVKTAIEALLECVRTIDPVFSDVTDVDNWWSTQLGEQINLDFDPNVSEAEFSSEMQRWGQGYANCVAPVVVAREGVRFAARQERISEQFKVLVELQADVTKALNP